MVPSRRATACHRRARWQARWGWRAPPPAETFQGRGAGGLVGPGGGGVAGATIVETFEGLVGEGLLESRVGAGTHVSQALHARVAPVDAPLDIESIASAKLTQAIAIAK